MQKHRGGTTIPSAPLSRLIRERHDAIKAENEFHRQYEQGRGPMQSIANEAGVPERRIYGLYVGEAPTINFDLADKIITRVFGPMTWLEDPELREIYDNVDLRRQDAAYPTTDNQRDHLVSRIKDAVKEHGSVGRAATALGISAHRAGDLLREAS